MSSSELKPAYADYTPLAAVDEKKAEQPFPKKVTLVSAVPNDLANKLQTKPPMSSCKIFTYCVTPGATFGAGTGALLAIFLKSSLAALIPGGAAVGAIAGWSVAYLLRNNSNPKPQAVTSSSANSLTGPLLDGQGNGLRLRSDEV